MFVSPLWLCEMFVFPSCALCFVRHVSGKLFAVSFCIPLLPRPLPLLSSSLSNDPVFFNITLTLMSTVFSLICWHTLLCGFTWCLLLLCTFLCNFSFPVFRVFTCLSPQDSLSSTGPAELTGIKELDDLSQEIAQLERWAPEPWVTGGWSSFVLFPPWENKWGNV